MEVSGQLHAMIALLLRKSLWYPLDRRVGVLKSLDDTEWRMLWTILGLEL
jgi:hypothetical protein